MNKVSAIDKPTYSSMSGSVKTSRDTVDCRITLGGSLKHITAALWSNILFCMQGLMKHFFTFSTRLLKIIKKSSRDLLFFVMSLEKKEYSLLFGNLILYGSERSKSLHRFFSKFECLAFGRFCILRTSIFESGGATETVQFQSPPIITL